jgi:ABC-type transport system substrate-binding protein
MRKTLIFFILAISAGLPLAVTLCCNNSPWPDGAASSETFFTSFSSAVKSLDPATSYYVHESAILDNIVEAPLDYDYLERPYKLTPRLLTEIPVPQYYAADGTLLSGDHTPESVHRVEYLLTLREDLRYQQHPCFARDDRGHSIYDGKNSMQLPKNLSSPQDFPVLDSRPMHPMDFKVALIRLCDPRLACPVYSTLSSFIAGMKECSRKIQQELEAQEAESGHLPQRQPLLIDYRTIPFSGLEVINDHQFKLILSRKYPQALYWLAMHFFAPMPWEALEFYHLAPVIDSGLSLKNWPVGSGPYLLEEMNPAVRMRLAKNPNFRKEFWDGAPGQALPFTEQIIFQYEREAIPNWIKFNQGYYDTSGIPSDMLDAATAFNSNGELALSQEMQERGMLLHCSVTPTIFYFGFNMLDPIVGGSSENNRFLRQAISIVLDYQEFIDIFLNGQGVPAQCVIPPGISGACKANEFVSPWDEQLGKPVRLPLQTARELMQKAGYPNGIAQDGSPLTLHLDHANAGASVFKAQFQWLKSKFALLGIQLEERPSELNRWRDKLQTGNWQLVFNKGWLADYPDPENFLFLFYSGNGTVQSKGRGANYVNYSSAEFDQLFRQLETMPDNINRQSLIEQACRILQKDAPCCWGYHPAKVILTHKWLNHYTPHDMSYSTMKYLGINTVLRKQMQNLWNRPRRWPIYAALIALSFFAFFALRGQNKPLHVSNKSNDVRHGLLSRTLPVKPVTDNTMENTAQ